MRRLKHVEVIMMCSKKSDLVVELEICKVSKNRELVNEKSRVNVGGTGDFAEFGHSKFVEANLRNERPKCR